MWLYAKRKMKTLISLTLIHWHWFRSSRRNHLLYWISKHILTDIGTCCNNVCGKEEEMLSGCWCYYIHQYSNTAKCCKVWGSFPEHEPPCMFLIKESLEQRHEHGGHWLVWNFAPGKILAGCAYSLRHSQGDARYSFSIRISAVSLLRVGEPCSGPQPCRHALVWG